MGTRQLQQFECDHDGCETTAMVGRLPYHRASPQGWQFVMLRTSKIEAHCVLCPEHVVVLPGVHVAETPLPEEEF